MRISQAVILICSVVGPVYGQGAPAQSPAESKGIPARATPGDYQFQARAGAVTIAAEFTGHALPTAEGPLSSEDYIAVEVALFGPAGAPLRISAQDFSLRVSGRRAPLPSQPFGRVLSSLKDPEYIPPEAPEQKSKSSIGAGGQEPSGPPPPVKIPVPVLRAMAQRVQKATLPEGDRVLPQAGLVFFQYRGKEENLHSVELLYEGPAGKAVLKLK
jgi:hypothetical protein